MLKTITDAIQNASTIILTTHKQCDGDGLGAQLGIYHALRSIGKTVRVLNVDATPTKYRFLEPDTHIQYFDGHFDPIEPTDLALVFDTNDKRLLTPLYTELEKKCKNILFIDHHPVLKAGPEPTPGSFINTKAASTGEIAFDIIKSLNIKLNRDIARAIYTSIAFDTQIFRYMRNSYRSHEIAAELLKFETEPSLIHRQMFGNYTAKKLKYLSKVLSEMEFFYEDRLVFLQIKADELKDKGLDPEDTRDLVDMMMNIETIEVGALIRENSDGSFKVSLRSKGPVEVNSLAESFDGGGHIFSAGASTQLKGSDLKEKIINHFKNRF